MKAGDRSTIYFGRAELLLPELAAGRRRVFLTDETVNRCHGRLFAGERPLLIGQGEGAKTLGTLAGVYRTLIERGADRTSLLVGAGGGIVTDVAGFAAATYMRGISFGFVPTTLLAQVDASAGGKNGVNVDGYKNMAGTFAQPEFVVVDVELLSTLPDREFRAGLAEVLKAGIIADPELFALAEANEFLTLRRDRRLTEEIVRRALRVKTDIVARDEREAGDRRLLNLGHTMAHAIEKCTHAMNHGEAVAVGTAMAARAAVRLGLLPQRDCDRIRAALAGIGFRTEPPVPVEELASAAVKDKKGAGDMIRIVLPTAIGRCTVRPVPAAALAELFAE